MVDEHPEVIKSQMEQTRSAMAEKLEALVPQVSATVKEATDAVSEAVSTVADVVGTTTEAVQTTVESVTNPFDIKGHFEKSPWLMMGGAVLTGVLVGKLLTPATPAHSSRPAPPEPKPEPAPEPRKSSVSSLIPSSLLPSNIVPSGLASVFEKPLDMVKGMALGSLFSVIRGVVASNVPKDWQGQLLDIVDDMGKELGATVMPDSHEQSKDHDEHQDHNEHDQSQAQPQQKGSTKTASKPQSRKREDQHGKRNGTEVARPVGAADR